MKKTILILLLASIFIPLNAYCVQPMDVLQASIDEVILTLENPVYQDDSQKSLQKEKLWNIIGAIFDFKEMSKRTLARNWKTFSTQQQTDFTEVFGAFLTDNYLKKIQSSFKGEKVAYLDYEIIGDTKAFVETKIIRGSIETPVNYSMLISSNTWRIYDVKIEGVSLMKNYRVQFNRILLKDSPDQLIETLRKKLEE